MATALAYVAATFVAAWGLAHAIATRQVLAGFEPISVDNRRVILQEWLAEAFTMWGLATLVYVATAIGGAGLDITAWVYRVVAGLLIALAALTSVTGARTPVIWFKICPFLLAGSAITSGVRLRRGEVAARGRRQPAKSRLVPASPQALEADHPMPEQAVRRGHR